MNEKKFWVVWNSDGFSPKVRHVDKGSACQEAQRLAALNPGKQFVVLEAMLGYGAAAITRTEYLF